MKPTPLGGPLPENEANAVRDYLDDGSPPPVPSVGEEEIARMIDPTAFENWQSQYESSSKARGEEFGRRTADHYYAKVIDDAKEKARRILAALPQHGWQDIASAPKDERVLVYQADEADDSTPQIAVWLDGGTNHKPGWYLAWDHTSLIECAAPTHWQPLPPLPAKEGE